MDVPDKSKDPEYPDVEPPSRGANRYLSSDNLNVEIVPQENCDAPYFANECIDGRDLLKWEEYGQYLHEVTQTGAKRRLAFDDAATDCTKKGRYTASYVSNDPLEDDSIPVVQGKRLNFSHSWAWQA